MGDTTEGQTWKEGCEEVQMEAKKEGGGVGARLHFCISQKELGFAKQLRRIKMQSFLQVDGAIVSMQPCSLAFLRAVGERGENDVAAFYPLGEGKTFWMQPSFSSAQLQRKATKGLFRGSFLMQRQQNAFFSFSCLPFL